MKDFVITKKVNEIMYSLMMKISQFFEGYSVVSDTNQNPHTFVEIYVTQISLKEYEFILEEFGQYFSGVAENSFIIPRKNTAHERMSIIIHLEKSSED